MTRPGVALADTHALTAAGLGYLAADAADHHRHGIAAVLLPAALGTFPTPLTQLS